jgi:ABC-type nitrate/sulfonate/bicarbonate transport system substrate-binding protein
MTMPGQMVARRPWNKAGLADHPSARPWWRRNPKEPVMDPLTLVVVSRNYFNLPAWIGLHAGLFAAEGIALQIDHIEGIEEVNERIHDGRAQLAYGVTEHVILDTEAGGHQAIIGGNVNRLPFSFIARPGLTQLEDLRGKKIGVSSLRAGSSSLIMRLLAARGLHWPGDYELVPCGPILARWDMLRQGEIDAGLQGAPLNHIALDLGFVSLGEPREEVPDFQFTSLDVDLRWARANRDLLLRFLRGFLRAHEKFYTDQAFARGVAMRETGIEARYADLAWEEYTRDAIFPRDAEASAAGVQALIETSALIRDLPARARTRAEDYIDRSWLAEARASL